MARLALARSVALDLDLFLACVTHANITFAVSKRESSFSMGVPSDLFQFEAKDFAFRSCVATP